MNQEKQCNCAHFQTQIVNATEGSYNTSFDWHCPVHGSLHKDFEAPCNCKNYGVEHLRDCPFQVPPTSNTTEKNTYTCEHGVVQPIGTHSHAPDMDTIVSTTDMSAFSINGCDCPKRVDFRFMGHVKGAACKPTDTAEKKCRKNHHGNCGRYNLLCELHVPTTDTSEQEPGTGYCTKCGLETQPTMKCKCPFRSTDTGDWRTKFDREFGFDLEYMKTLPPTIPTVDVGLLIGDIKTFIASLLEHARQIEHCDEPACPECAVAAYERGKVDGRSEEATNCYEHVKKAWREGFTTSSEATVGDFEAGLKKGREEVRSKIWKNDEAHKMGRTSAFAEVKEVVMGMMKERDSDLLASSATVKKTNWYNRALFDLLNKLTDKQV